MSLFAYIIPRFKIGSVTITLDYFLLTKNEPETKELIIENEIYANRDIINQGEYWVIEGQVNLFKYVVLTTIKTKFNTIYQYNKQQVFLYKQNTGDLFVDKDMNPVPFILTVIPKNLTTMDCNDILFVQFRSVREIDFQAGLSYDDFSKIIMSEGW